MLSRIVMLMLFRLNISPKQQQWLEKKNANVWNKILLEKAKKINLIKNPLCQKFDL